LEDQGTTTLLMGRRRKNNVEFVLGKSGWNEKGARGLGDRGLKRLTLWGNFKKVFGSSSPRGRRVTALRS